MQKSLWKTDKRQICWWLFFSWIDSWIELRMGALMYHENKNHGIYIVHTIDIRRTCQASQRIHERWKGFTVFKILKALFCSTFGLGISYENLSEQLKQLFLVSIVGHCEPRFIIEKQKSVKCKKATKSLKGQLVFCEPWFFGNSSYDALWVK